MFSAIFFAKKFLEYLRTLSLKFQIQGRPRTTSILVRAFWNSRCKVLKYFRTCCLHNTLIPNLAKPSVMVCDMSLGCRVKVLAIMRLQTLQKPKPISICKLILFSFTALPKYTFKRLVPAPKMLLYKHSWSSANTVTIVKQRVRVNIVVYI